MGKQIIFAALMLLASPAFASGFVNLKDDQTIRANGGQVTIVVEGLSVLSIDGQSVDLESSISSEDGLRTIYTLDVVDRGTHELSLTAEDGSVETITVHVQRVKRARK